MVNARVKQVMSIEVHTCRPEDPLAMAAQRMWEHDCGALPVVSSGGQVVGMITDRDICMGAHLQRKNLSSVQVSWVMSASVYSCSPEDTLEQAERIMRDKQVHRLPVLAPEGSLVGIISLNDVARYAAHDPRPAEDFEEVAKTLAAIGTPRQECTAAAA